MIGKKINQLATELAPANTDLTIIGDPISGVSKKITLAQLGAIFGGSASFYDNLASFPATGDIDVIYCAKDTQKLYLWSGTAYVQTFPSQALLDTYQLRSEKGNANGYASLDSAGKVPISQLPNSIMEYKGTWSAATNTPTLANGTGDTGDVYLCNAAGTVNFGAGPITFAVGDYVVYSGSIYQRSSGAVGTVTSVGLSITGDAVGVTGSPVTTSGTLALAFAGTSAQYVNGAGNLITFPAIISQAQNLVTEVYNETGATLTKGTIVYINGGHGNLPTITKALATGDSTSAQTYGIVQADITNNNNGYVVVTGRLENIDTQAYTGGTQLYLSSTTAGTWTSTKQYAPAHLVYVGIVVRSHPTQGIVEVKIQNGYEMDEIHNVSAQTPSNNDGLFYNTSTSLWENKSIATTLGFTPISLTSLSASSPLSYNSGTGAFSISQASTSANGYLSSTDWNTFNNKQAAGNYVTLDTFQNITASKTFDLGFSIASAGGTNQLTSFINTNSIHSGSAGSNVFGFNSSNNIFFGKGLDNGGVISWNNAAVRYYTLPNADGTIALTSDITGGTVTSVAALTLGTSGTDLNSSVANGTTTPVITLNVPTASATNRGALSSADWSTFNNKQAALSGTGFVKISGTTISYDNSTYYLASNPDGYTNNLGTVTSVGLSSSTSGVTIGSTPITTSGTITLAIATASGSQQGLLSSTDWTTFNSKQDAITSPVTGSGDANYVTKWQDSTGTLINSNIYDGGIGITNVNPTAGQFAWQFNGSTTSGQSYGALICAGTNASDIALRIQNASNTSVYFYVWGDGRVQMNNIPNATTDTDKFLVSDGGVIKYRTGAELLSDIGAQASGTYVNSVFGRSGAVTAQSGDYTTAQVSESGNLYYTEARVDANTNVAANTAARHNAVTLGTANGLSLSTQVLSLGLASTSATGALSSTDWNTFNGKQGALTLTTTGSSGAATLVGNTLNIPQYGGSGVTSVTASAPLSSSGGSTPNITISQSSSTTNGYLSSTDWNTFNGKENTLTFSTGLSRVGNTITNTITQYTDSSARASLSFTAGSGAYNSTSGVITIPTNNNQITNGSNFITLGSLSAGSGISYNNSTGVISSTITQYTDASARASISLTTSGTSGAATYNSTTGAFNIPQYQMAGTYVSSVTASGPISSSGGVNPNITISQATSSTNGYLSSTDWSTFNNKQNALTSPVTGTGTFGYHTKFTGTSTIGNSIVYDNGSSVGIGTSSPQRILDIHSSSVSYVRTTQTTSSVFNELYATSMGGFVGTASSHNLAFVTAGFTRMTLTSAGLLFINTTMQVSTGFVSLIANLSSNIGIAVRSSNSMNSGQFMQFQNSMSTQAGAITHTGATTIAFTTSSDYRLKQDFKDFNGIELINKIKTYDYEWKSDKKRGYGVIAHELQSIIGYAVSGVKDGETMQGVDYSKIVPLLVKAVQEQQKEIEQLKNK